MYILRNKAVPLHSDCNLARKKQQVPDSPLSGSHKKQKRKKDYTEKNYDRDNSETCR